MDPPPSPAPGSSPRIIPYAIPERRIDPDAAKVVRRLTRYGYQAYLVGGCVRDLLLNRTPKDFDVATSARPADVKSLFRNCRIIGRRFRLAHVLFGSSKLIEVATFRRDPKLELDTVEWEGESDEAVIRPRAKNRDEDLLIRQDNTFGEPHEDAARRDFTMNALFYDLDRQEIVDYVGGMADIQRKLLRTIGEPDVRFREDPVRILRALRFAGRLDVAIEPDVYDAMIVHREDLLRSARPRLMEELLRLSRSGASRRSFWLAWETGVLSVLLPELSSFLDDDSKMRSRLWRRLGIMDARIAEGQVMSEAVLLSTLLLEPVEEAIEGERDPLIAVGDFLADTTERLALPRRLFDRMRAVLAVQRRLSSGRVGALARRDFYNEAALTYSLDAEARGVPAEDIRAVISGRDVSQKPRKAAPAVADPGE
ncbi:MAG: polynucleotide adenylyltransferase PcnB [Deltaproteobacteria bacterium]|nr:polynucleotide adenylyltransferase PcnB [Deltaproteobacteria bacterium]